MRARTPCITVKSSCYFSLLCGDSVWRSVHFRSASLRSLSFCSAVCLALKEGVLLVLSHFRHDTGSLAGRLQC